MRKSWIWAILMIALLLVSACRPAAEDLDSDSSEETAAEVVGACKPEEECDDEPVEGTEPVEETADPTATPVEESAVVEPPPALGDDPLAITDADWVKGPDDAFITIVEYGDFQ